MRSKFSQSLKLELVWWIVTAFVLYAIFYPISRQIHAYPFLVMNSIFVIVFITFTRYIFLLKHTFLAKLQWVKLILIFLCIPLVFYLIQAINNFQTFLDEQGVEAFLKHLPLDEQDNIGGYIRSEMLLFGTGSIITAIMLPLRLVISVWRTHNKGTV